MTIRRRRSIRICAEIERQLRGGEPLMDAAAASELLPPCGTDTQPRPLVIVHGLRRPAVIAPSYSCDTRCEVLDAMAATAAMCALLIDAERCWWSLPPQAWNGHVLRAERRRWPLRLSPQELPGRVGCRAAVQSYAEPPPRRSTRWRTAQGLPRCRLPSRRLM